LSRSTAEIAEYAEILGPRIGRAISAVSAVYVESWEIPPVARTVTTATKRQVAARQRRLYTMTLPSAKDRAPCVDD
jgi:hypothetical protein